MVEIIGAPGYEDFQADLIMEAPRVDGVMMCVVGDDCGEVHVIPAEYVFPAHMEAEEC